MLQRNPALTVVDALTLLIMDTASSIKRLLALSLISIVSGSISTTRRAGRSDAAFSWQSIRGARNVCAQTSMLQPRTWTMWSRIEATLLSSSPASCDRCVTLAIPGRPSKKSGGGVAKMFRLGEPIAYGVILAKKIPNVRILGVAHAC